MTSLDVIYRRAITSSGSPGSLYNGYRDCVLEEPTMISKTQKSPPRRSIQCEIIDCSKEKSPNLLKMIDIEDDLRLNILLNSSPRIGLAAIVDYPRRIGNYTRLLYISYVDREQRLPDDPTDARKYVKSSLHHVDATHIITGVSFGIAIVVMLQLPCQDKLVKKIDVALQNIRDRLNNSQDFSDFTRNYEEVLEKVDKTTVYSNVSELTKMESLLEVCEYIERHKKTSEMYRPLIYSLRPIKWLDSDAYEACALYMPIDKEASDDLEQHLIKLSKTISRFKHWFDCEVTSLPFQHLQGQLNKATSQWQDLQQAYKKEIKHLRKLMFGICSGERDACGIKQTLEHNNGTILKKNIEEMTQLMKSLQNKRCLISDLQGEHFDYCNVAESKANKNDDEKILKNKPVNDNQYDFILCSSDIMNKENPDQWEQKTSQLRTEYEKKHDIHLLYADFSYCPFELHDITILPTNKPNEKPKVTEQTAHYSTAVAQSPTSSTILPASTDNYINILLLGESGVGKSTFINAFVNYLKFKTFDQARSGTPVVLIPVSFVITTGNDFEEHTVKFGDTDNLNNEDFDHSGQSVTQHCKSYLFDLDRNKDSHLRIIDTPGFGDTRGIGQDDFNMKHIIEYINNLTHLNAICFLLKPNTSQINNFFRTCLTQLLDLLGPNACQNIIFCFTNARSTVYSPGDTAPLLKDILKSLSMNDIPFKKENTFCFDNESFRYLVALQNSVTFDDHDKEEYEMSWSKSVTESKRFRSYIRKNLTARYIHDEQQSAKRAELEIVHMIRPMLQAIRNILRNIVLWKMDTSDKSIELTANSLSCPITVCLTCKYDLIQKGKFWIARDVPHQIQKKSHCCECASSQHMLIDYQIDYEYSDKSTNQSHDEIERRLEQLCDASVKFAHFLMYNAHSSKDDPFWIGITQMIGEENDIGKIKNSNMNLKLAKKLTERLHSYEQQIDDINSSPQHSKISIIYELIQTVCKYPLMKTQMAAVRKTQKKIMKLYEYKVPENRANTSPRSTATS